jgi:Heterokaryon incompatibility protein (HET)
MRLLKVGPHGELSLTEDFVHDIPPYAILSHTWGADKDEVTFDDLVKGLGKRKHGYTKIEFCGKQARKDGLKYIWVDTCCINKANHTELSEAITSMFRWYRDAVKCYAYLSDVFARKHDNNGQTQRTWESAFRISRWFTRGWTLQELLAPKSVKFFSREGELLGDKKILEQQIHEITGVPITALRGKPLSHFSVDERMRWAAKRGTKREEDKAHCLAGIFEIFIPLMYGEGEHAFKRLQEEIDKRSSKKTTAVIRPGTRLTLLGTSTPPAHVHWMVTRPVNPLLTGREDLLQELTGIVSDTVKKPLNKAQCRIIITGMGGQGKSEICLQLALRVRQV